MSRELLIMGRTRNLRDVEANNEEKPANWRDWVLVFLWSFLGYMCIILAVLTYYNPGILPFDVTSVLFRKEISPFFAFSQGSNHYSKPKGFKIVALVPFTDHEPTSILDCYLQKNLVHNDGFLDQVVFVAQTNDPLSMEWLYSIVNQTPEYAIAPAGQDMEWKSAMNNVMYIRIAGDTVFLEDHTIPTIVNTKLDNPSSLMVSANVVNEAALASLHSHPGIALPYLPELYHVDQPSRSNSELHQDWRASSLPNWQGPLSFKVNKDFKPPFEGHRWLLPSDKSMDRDPISASVYTDTGPTLDDWTVGAQQHYSFLYHLENNDLGRYKFPIWVDPTEPISQNFGCFWGNDAVAVHHMFRHNSKITASHPEKPDGNRPHVIIDGKGLVSHYSSRQGAAGLDATDLLARYRAYAEERVCLQTE